MIAAVADTGFIVAVLHRGDSYHQKAIAVYQQIQQIYLPQTTLAEIAYLLHEYAGQLAMAEFLEKLPTSKLSIVSITMQDLNQTAAILRQYADSRIDFVDATVMAVAERLEITTILTVDYRDFRLYRPNHCSHFTLLPEA
ncbi:MAG TPA: PIN domain-containing protein [Anaerolineae bacterium]|nr:PIN domain-containing protein [Anaerolineae bacterium]